MFTSSHRSQYRQRRDASLHIIRLCVQRLQCQELQVRAFLVHYPPSSTHNTCQRQLQLWYYLQHLRMFKQRAAACLFHYCTYRAAPPAAMARLATTNVYVCILRLHKLDTNRCTMQDSNCGCKKSCHYRLGHLMMLHDLCRRWQLSLRCQLRL